MSKTDDYKTPDHINITSRSEYQRPCYISSVLKETDDPIYLVDFETNFLDANECFCKKTGFDRNELLQMRSVDLRPEEVRERTRIFVERLREERHLSIDSFYLCKNGAIFPVEVAATVLQLEEEPLILVVLRDMDRLLKKSGSGINENKMALLVEELVAKNKEFYKANIALQELLANEREKKDAQRIQIQKTLSQLVNPYIEQLLAGEMKEKELEYVKIIHAHLQTLGEEFIHRLDDPGIGLNQKELLMANLIRQGKKSPEIARLMGLTIRTVEVYRSEIRKKLKISNKRINLHSYLQKRFSI